jgi:hypothetical protein
VAVKEEEEMKWSDITEKERQAIVDALPGGLDGFLKGWGWQQFAQAIEDKCREKNERPESAEAEFDVVGDDMPCASACGPREAALAEARHYALQYLDEYLTVRIEEVARTVVERFTRIR